MVFPCSSSIVKLGPWGEGKSPGSGPWVDGGGYTGIRGLTVGHSWEYGVETLQVEYDLFGEPVQGEKHGGGAQKWEPQTNEYKLDLADEFLTTISGCHSGAGTSIMSLTFKTNNNREIGPFGRRFYRSRRYYFDQQSKVKDQYSFDYSVEGGKGAIIGFSGVSGWYLDSIAIYVAVLCPADEFFDEMMEKGYVAYRTSPLCMAPPSAKSG